jgi:hypothetical protein
VPPPPRANLHVVLCLSPVGNAFRERCRTFPGLINCTTIDWFTEWPADALFEVAARRLSDDPSLPAILGPPAAEAARAAAARLLVAAHQSVEEGARRMWAALRRRVYITPTNFLECVSNYTALLGEKRAELAGKAGKLQGGLLKLDETRAQVAEMQGIAAAKAAVVAQAKAECEELLVAIVQVRGLPGPGLSLLVHAVRPSLRGGPCHHKQGSRAASNSLPDFRPRPNHASCPSHPHALPGPRTSGWPMSRRRRSMQKPPRSPARPRRPTPLHSR